MDRYYVCIDLKTFFASVECVERGLDPMKVDLIVADPSRGKGSICLAITSHMKSLGIKNRCRVFEIPENVHPIVAVPRMRKYIEYSSKVYSIYLKYISPEDIHPYSIDEMFLDVTSYLKLYKKTPMELGKMLQEEIYNTLGLRSSCGVGTNMYLTKIALDIMAKKNPESIAFLDEETFKKELWHHKPLTDFWQIGRGISTRLEQLKIFDQYDIAHYNPKVLYKEFGKAAELLIDHANGIEPCTIADIKAYKPKSRSISNSQILFSDYDFDKARIVLQEMIDGLTLRLLEEDVKANTVSYYIGYSKDIYPPTGGSMKMDRPSSSSKTISRWILKAYDENVSHILPIRKIGICFGNLAKEEYVQYDLFSEVKNEIRDSKIESAVIEIQKKYGKNAILKAASYQEGATQRMRNKLIGGHNAE